VGRLPCNGAERCDPRAAGAGPRGDWSENLGCVGATARLDLPCERTNGDGDGCTVEACCEPWDPARCRISRKIERKRTAAIDGYKAICNNWPSTLAGVAWCPNVALSPATLETLRIRGGGPTFSKLGRRGRLRSGRTSTRGLPSASAGQREASRK